MGMSSVSPSFGAPKPKANRRRWSVTNQTMNGGGKKDDKADSVIKKPHVEKFQINHDVILSDRTVNPNDPRVVDAFESMTRIRKRTGFDSSLIRDKIWATKTTKDLKKGLEQIDRLDTEKLEHLVGKERAIEAEKAAFQRRKSKYPLSRTRSSETVPANVLAAASEQFKLQNGVRRLSVFMDQVERDGGFLPSIPGATRIDNNEPSKSSLAVSVENEDIIRQVQASQPRRGSCIEFSTPPSQRKNRIE